MSEQQPIFFEWYGAAHYHICTAELRIVTDPLYTRLPGDVPHLTAHKDELDMIDYLLLTHGHLDHSYDFPYLASRYDPVLFAPDRCLKTWQRKTGYRGAAHDPARQHGLEGVKGRTFELADIELTPYQIGTEQLEPRLLIEWAARPLRHRAFGTLKAGVQWLATELYGNCFAFHFHFKKLGKTLLFLGNLTEQVNELATIERVDVLALPYCPANYRWLEQSQFLIERFAPTVTLVHHFDNFMPPYTRSEYMSLDDYRRGMNERCPEAKLFFSKFRRPVTCDEILAVRG